MLLVGWVLSYALYLFLQAVLRDRERQAADLDRYHAKLEDTDAWLTAAKIAHVNAPASTADPAYLRQQLRETQVSRHHHHHHHQGSKPVRETSVLVSVVYDPYLLLCHLQWWHGVIRPHPAGNGRIWNRKTILTSMANSLSFGQRVKYQTRYGGGALRKLLPKCHIPILLLICYYVMLLCDVSLMLRFV